MKNYLNTYLYNSDLWIALQEVNLESLLKKAKELEKKYEWLQATKIYKRASDLARAECIHMKAPRKCYIHFPNNSRQSGN